MCRKKKHKIKLNDDDDDEDNLSGHPSKVRALKHKEKKSNWFESNNFSRMIKCSEI